MSAPEMPPGLAELRAARSRWRNLERAAAALEATGHETAAQVRADADTLGLSEITVTLPCVSCHQPTACEMPVAFAVETPPEQPAQIVLVIGGEPQAVLCKACNAAVSDDPADPPVDVWAVTRRDGDLIARVAGADHAQATTAARAVYAVQQYEAISGGFALRRLRRSEIGPGGPGDDE